MKLLITGAFKCAEENLKAIAELGNEIVFMQNESEELPCDYGEVEGVICNGLFLHHDIEKFSSLKYIQLTSAGLDRVPLDYINRKGIKLYNAAGVYSAPMAEFALCGVLDLYKRSRFFAENQRAHKWEKHRNILELCGKTVSIIGCGSVGRECAKRFSAFGTTVLGVDIVKPEGDLFCQYFPIKNIKAALRLSDIVILTLPLNDSTRYMFDEDMLSELKDGCLLVNISRGAVIKEEALISALKCGNLSGAVLDVFEEEPLSPDNPLWDMENVILTPHNSFVGEGNGQRLFEAVYRNLV